MLRQTRVSAALSVLIAGACTTAMNWRFSYQLGTNEVDSIVLATFSVALDVAKWLMLPFAALAWRTHKLRATAAFAIWLVASIYSFAAAIGFSALARETAVAEQAVQEDLRTTLELMRQSPRWKSSAACADATAPQSKEFCTHYAEVAARITGAPRGADPQSALFARMTGLSPDTVRVVLSVFLAVACEIISALGFFAIMRADTSAALHEVAQPVPQQKSSQKPIRWTPPKWSPKFPPTKSVAHLGWHGRT